MRFQSTVLAIAASLAFVNAQDLSSVPECAIPCFVAAIPGSGCGIADTKCQCTTGRDAIQGSLVTCAPGRCQPDDIAKLAPAVSSLCAAAGVTVSDLPTGAVSSGMASATGSAKSAATSAMSGSRTATGSMSATGSSAPEQTASGAGAKVVGYGAMAMGMAAVFGL